MPHLDVASVPSYAINHGVTYAMILGGISAADSVKWLENEQFNFLVICGFRSKLILLNFSIYIMKNEQLYL